MLEFPENLSVVLFTYGVLLLLLFVSVVGLQRFCIKWRREEVLLLRLFISIVQSSPKNNYLLTYLNIIENMLYMFVCVCMSVRKTVIELNVGGVSGVGGHATILNLFTHIIISRNA